MDTELSQLLGNLSLDDLDNVVNRMERVQNTNNRDDDVMGLLGAMKSLNVIADSKKLSKAIVGVKNYRKKVFAKKYKSLKGKKAKAISSAQMDDMFAAMDALKEEEDSMDLEDIMAELNDVIDDDDVSMGGGAKKKLKMRRQKGGMRLKKLPKDLENIITDYKKQFEDQEKKQKNLRKQIDQKYKKLQKLENKEQLTDKESIELMTIDIEIPIYVKYYLLNDGDYSKLLISKYFANPDDLETDESELYQDEKDILKKVKKSLYGGGKKLKKVGKIYKVDIRKVKKQHVSQILKKFGKYGYETLIKELKDMRKYFEYEHYTMAELNRKKINKKAKLNKFFADNIFEKEFIKNSKLKPALQRHSEAINKEFKQLKEIQKGGFSQRGPYEVHSRWPRFKIDQNMAMRDLKSVNQRGLRSLKVLKGGDKMMKDLIKKVRKDIRTEKQLEKIMMDSVVFEAEMINKLHDEIKEIDADISASKKLAKLEPKFKAMSVNKVKELEEQKKILKKFLNNLQKGGSFSQKGPYEKHSKYPRFKIDQKNAMRDLKSTNKRSLLRGGAKKKKIVKKSKK